MFLRAAAFGLFGLVALFLSGCGGEGQLEVAPVRGTVTCNGTPITSGSVSFSPISEEAKGMPGKAAFGVIGSDGTFVLSTYEEGDGAVLGKHRVTYTPELPGQVEGSGEEEGDSGMGEPITASRESMMAAAKSGLPCRFGGTATATVKAGENNLTIALTPTGPGGGARSDSGLGE